MTKEDLMQIKQLLDEQEERYRQYMNVIIESDITPKFNLLAEETQNVKEHMATKERVDELEERMDDRFDILEATVKYHGTEINRLKKAQ